MGRNYRFLFYGARPELAALLRELATMADPPRSKDVTLRLDDGESLTLRVDADSDKNEPSLDLQTLGTSLQLQTWLTFSVSDPKDAALEFVRSHWEPDNRTMPQGQVRFGVNLEITLSGRFYELALSSWTSSVSGIFSFSPAVRERVRTLLVHAWFGLFDSEQAAYKLLPREQADTGEWGSLQLSFEEEDMILYSDRAGNLSACVNMLQKKIDALPDKDRFKAPSSAD